jgi:predicted DNA-binding transcriptional regulator YafY
LTKTNRQAELIKLIAKEPWQHDKKSIAQILQTSESTIQRDIEELGEKDYRFAQSERNTFYLVQSGWFDQSVLKDSALRQVEILQLLYRVKKSLSVPEIARRLNQESKEEVFGEKTIERAVKDLHSKGLVLRKGNLYGLNPSHILPPFELSENERRVFYEALKLAKALNPLPDQIPALEAKLKLKIPLEERRETIYIHGRTPSHDIRRTQYCNALEQAAREKILLTILYRKEDFPAKEYKLKPLGIVYYWVLDKWYFVAEYHGEIRTFAVEQILHIEWHKEHFTEPEVFNLKDYFKYSWGMYHSDSRTEVKIRFYNHYSTIQRVKDELKFRETCVLFEDKEGLVITDEVDGLQELAVWLRGFGPNAEVIYPEALKELLQKEWTELRKLYLKRGESSDCS